MPPRRWSHQGPCCALGPSHQDVPRPVGRCSPSHSALSLFLPASPCTGMFGGLRLLVSACGSFLPALGWAMALLSLCMMLGFLRFVNCLTPKALATGTSGLHRQHLIYLHTHVRTIYNLQDTLICNVITHK